MCSSKNRGSRPCSLEMDPNVAKINGRLVLQPTCNRVLSSLERRNSIKKTTHKSPTSPPSPNGLKIRPNKLSPSPPICPNKPKSPLNDGLNCEAIIIKSTPKLGISKSMNSNRSSNGSYSSSSSSSSSSNSGSIAALRREEVANIQAMRKMKIAHYGRTKSIVKKVVPIDSSIMTSDINTGGYKRCNFISPNSDPIYVAYHDEEWGVPVHDDKLLFELLVLTTAQLGSDWSSVLKKRQHFRDAFSNFEAEVIANFNERKVAFICCEYGMELSQVRGAIDNAKQILKIKEQFGSFNEYLWRFVNYKPISTQYKNCQKIPVKTSKSEGISKDLIKRGFRFVGPAVIHSFMQAAGLTNDHLITCPRHSHCSSLSK